jgi:hypothetical protein
MSDYVAVEFDALTGETIQREFTADEIKQHKADVASNKKREAEIESKATARKSALAKLAELGLTEAEIAAL